MLRHAKGTSEISENYVLGTSTENKNGRNERSAGASAVQKFKDVEANEVCEGTSVLCSVPFGSPIQMRRIL